MRTDLPQFLSTVKKQKLVCTLGMLLGHRISAFKDRIYGRDIEEDDNDNSHMTAGKDCEITGRVW